MPSIAVSVRRALVDDLDELVALNEEFCRADHHPFDAATVRQALGPLLRDDEHGIVWMVQTDDRPGIAEGYGVVTWGYSLEAGGRESIFDEMYVRRPGLGIGGAAMAIIIDQVRSLGVARIYLETEAHNERGRRLYRRLGFVDEDSVWMNLDFRPPSHRDGQSG